MQLLPSQKLYVQLPWRCGAIVCHNWAYRCVDLPSLNITIKEAASSRVQIGMKPAIIHIEFYIFSWNSVVFTGIVC